MMMESILNFNVGVLGHIDCGKTSLAKALSTTASTASFDKNPQSQERGITIDLGFSSFVVDAPSHIKEKAFDKLQFTLVDCPGHGSLIRTIIGGAQIIDAMMLVLDVTKGMQTQTAECLVIGEILCNHMLIVLNKIDLLPAEKREATIIKLSRKMQATLKGGKLSSSKVVAVAAKPGGPAAEREQIIGIDVLIEAMKDLAYLPKRNETLPFVFSVDHCFSIKGQGTVFTGTILQGSVSVNDTLEVPTLKQNKKVKSMQMFHKPVNKAKQGDRLGICVTQFDPKLVERGIIGSPSYIKISKGVLINVNKIKHYTSEIVSKSKLHISIGHDTVIGNITFIGTDKPLLQTDSFNFEEEYMYLSHYIDAAKTEDHYIPCNQFAVIEFEKSLPVLPHALVIGSKLDMDIHTHMCRLCLWGNVMQMLPDDYKQTVLPNIRAYKAKSRRGVVERLHANSDSEVIVKGLTKKGTDVSLFQGLKVRLSSGEEGVIEGSFGQSGKLKVVLRQGLKETTKQTLQESTGKGRKGKAKERETQINNGNKKQSIEVTLNFKKYVFRHDKKMVQNY